MKSNNNTAGTIDTYGGALVNLIHGYTDNGDPFVRQFTDQLLEEVSSATKAPNFAINIVCRCLSHFSRPFTDGCFLASFTIHSLSFSWQ
jgi:hypothetical protein